MFFLPKICRQSVVKSACADSYYPRYSRPRLQMVLPGCSIGLTHVRNSSGTKEGKRHTCREPFAAWEEIKTTTAWEEIKATAPVRKSGYLSGGAAEILFFIILEGLLEWTELYADSTGRAHCLVCGQDDRHPLLVPCYKQRLLSALFPHLALLSLSHPSRRCCLYCFHCHIHPGGAVCIVSTVISTVSAVCIVSTVTSIQAVLFVLFPLSHPSRRCCLYCFHCHIYSQCCLYCFHCHIHPGGAVCIVSTVTSIQAVLFVLFPLSYLQSVLFVLLSLSHPSRRCCLYCFHCHIYSQCCLYCFHCHIHPGGAVCIVSTVISTVSAVCIAFTVTSIQAVLFVLFPLSYLQSVLFVLLSLSHPSRQCCLCAQLYKDSKVSSYIHASAAVSTVTSSQGPIVRHPH